ncbi:flagella biosynthesis regulator Flk [Brenneria izadpanahii]|uniref:Flagella biosynthesis regulator Flk n=1 Tax=Brenneria izadpanahii TaxID=2722756 RepID=A0ABX7UTL9_9GAMM|nr:flagella biosynthesis regulator Flk [Brenneria izadpanahii]QTF07717.1 flagella biosynthesis regulator Flk [Brenneria izadpanahii]
MQPVSGPGAPLPGERATGPTSPAINAGGGDQPLTPAQRTTLENLIVKIASLSTLKTAEIWNGVKQGLGLTENAELMSRHYQPAEQLLQTRLTEVQRQDNAGRQQLLQRLTEMLPEGNNRQAVSDFIRQQFGHTVLSSLNKTQLQQVVAFLQNGLTPQPAAGTTAMQQPSPSNPLDRPLLPAEQNSLNQLVVRLASQTGEQPAKIWAALMTMQNLNSGDAIPAKNLQLLTQFLQAQASLHQTQATASRQAAPTAFAANDAAPGSPAANAPNAANTPAAASNSALANLSLLQTVLPRPLDAQEQQMMLDYMQNRFNAGAPLPMTPMQLSEALTFLFSQRIQRSQESGWTAPQPLLNPLIAAIPPNWQSLFQKPMFTVIVGVCVAIFLLWVLF